MTTDRIQQIKARVEAATEGKWINPEDDTLRIEPGSRRNLTAGIWRCGDDYCNCSALVIQAQFTHLLGPWNPWCDVWQGEFKTDGEPFTPEGIAGWMAACAEVGLPEPCYPEGGHEQLHGRPNGRV